MNDTDSVTLREYYLSFKSISGVMAGLFSSIPLLSKLIPKPTVLTDFLHLEPAKGPPASEPSCSLWP